MNLTDQDALAYHCLGGKPGKISVVPSKPLENQRDLSLAYHYLSNQSDQWGAEGSNAGLALMVETVTLLAQLSLRAGHAEAAAEHLRSCLAWLDTEVESGGQENRALLESLLGRAEPEPQLALEAHQRALKLYTQLVDEQGQYQLLPNLAEAHLGSTPKSRTVAKGLRTSGPALRLFASSLGCGTARCIRTHRPSPHRVSGKPCGRPARA